MASLIVIGAFIWQTPDALALRPFVTTDADVAEPMGIELESGVAGFTLRKNPGPDDARIQSPAIRFNLGFPWDWEIVLESVHEWIDKRATGGFDADTDQWFATGAFIKKVWYRGHGWIPNFGTETGALIPTERGAERLRDVDFSGIALFSWFLKPVIWHITLGGETRHSGKTEPPDTRKRFVFGTIVDVPVPGMEKLHLVAEYSGNKAEKEPLKHQLLGGVVFETPWHMDLDAAGFGGLSAESTDWGMTAGFTLYVHEKKK